MPTLSQRVQHIKSSVTFTIIQKAKEMQAAGQKVINLAGGEPDFNTPEFICQAVIKAMDEGLTKYTAVDGTPELKQKIIAKFKRDNELSFNPENVIVSTGGKQVIFNAFMATIDPGDEVIIPAPYWVSYPDMARLVDGEPVIVKCDKNDGLKITPEKLAAAITPKTKWFILNSPNNPTGSVYTRGELKALGEVLESHPHVRVMSDDIYEHIVYEGYRFTTLAQVCPNIAERVLTVNGMSKAFAMTGWRLGYAGGEATLIKAMKTIQSQSTSCPSSIAQAAATEGLSQPMDFLPGWVKQYQQRRDYIVEQLQKMGGLEPMIPHGAFYIFADCSQLIGKKTPDNVALESDKDFATYLIESAGVAVVPGAAFGYSPYIRMSIAASMEELQETAKRLEKAISDLS